MYKRFSEINDFRTICQWSSMTDFWLLYEQLETNDDEYNVSLYNKIEAGFENWVKKNTKKKVYYAGDLVFEFESKKERDQFDAECGDPLAFKLIYA